MALNPALANNIALVKNYVDDNDNAYAVFKKASLTADLETPFIDFVGAKTMSYPVFPLDSTDFNDYSATTGFVREATNLVRREKTVSQDKGYQIGIDYLDLESSHTTAIAHLNNKIRQKDVPNIDKYRLTALASFKGVQYEATAITKSNIIEKYDGALAKLVDAEVPTEHLIMYVPTATYTALKQADANKRIVANMDTNLNRNVEFLDGTTKIVQVPATRMPAGVEFILVNPTCVICGVKHSVARLVEEPEAFDGILINRRIVHDCFVEDDRAKGIFVQFKATSNVPSSWSA